MSGLSKARLTCECRASARVWVRALAGGRLHPVRFDEEVDSKEGVERAAGELPVLMRAPGIRVPWDAGHDLAERCVGGVAES